MLKRHATFVVAVLVAAIAFTAVGVGRPVTAHAYSACQTYLETKACAINWYGGLDAVTNYDGGAGWSEGSCYYMDLEVYVDGNLWWSHNGSCPNPTAFQFTEYFPGCHTYYVFGDWWTARYPDGDSQADTNRWCA